MRKVYRTIFLVILIILSMNLFSIFGYEVHALDYSEMINQANDFIGKGKEQSESVNVTAMTSEFIPLGQILTMIGAGVMVAVTTFMGIKYLTAGPDAQAKLKQQLVGVIVSGFVIFGAYGIWSTVLRIVENFE